MRLGFKIVLFIIWCVIKKNLANLNVSNSIQLTKDESEKNKKINKYGFFFIFF